MTCSIGGGGSERQACFVRFKLNKVKLKLNKLVCCWKLTTKIILFNLEMTVIGHYIAPYVIIIIIAQVPTHFSALVPERTEMARSGTIACRNF